MRIPTGPDITLHLTESGTGRPVLAVHGWMTTGRVFDPLVARIDARWLVPDLRGAGLSSRPAQGYALHDYVADLEAVLDHLALPEVTVLGHSMGGAIAQLLARRPEVTRLVLLCPVPVSGVPLPSGLATMFRDSGGNSQAQGAILDMATLWLSAQGRSFLADLAADVSPECVRDAFDAWSAGVEAPVEAISATTHVIATSDPFLPAAFLQGAVVDRIPGATLHLLEGPGHYPQIEAPEATAAVLRPLLQGS